MLGSKSLAEVLYLQALVQVNQYTDDNAVRTQAQLVIADPQTKQWRHIRRH